MAFLVVTSKKWSILTAFFIHCIIIRWKILAKPSFILIRATNVLNLNFLFLSKTHFDTSRFILKPLMYSSDLSQFFNINNYLESSARHINNRTRLLQSNFMNKDGKGYMEDSTFDVDDSGKSHYNQTDNLSKDISKSNVMLKHFKADIDRNNRNNMNKSYKVCYADAKINSKSLKSSHQKKQLQMNETTVSNSQKTIKDEYNLEKVSTGELNYTKHIQVDPYKLKNDSVPILKSSDYQYNDESYPNSKKGTNDNQEKLGNAIFCNLNASQDKMEPEALTIYKDKILGDDTITPASKSVRNENILKNDGKETKFLQELDTLEPYDLLKHTALSQKSNILSQIHCSEKLPLNMTSNLKPQNDEKEKCGVKTNDAKPQKGNERSLKFNFNMSDFKIQKENFENTFQSWLSKKDGLLPKLQKPYSRGIKKRAFAWVHLRLGTGKIEINGKDGCQYLRSNKAHLKKCFAPLAVMELEKKYDIQALCHGGGVGGQSSAIQLAISRELIRIDPDIKSRLRKEGFITVDSRKVERKKYGLKKARKAPQFSKR